MTGTKLYRSRRIWAAVAIWLAGSVLLTGCWDQREINNVTIITGLAIDKGSRQRYRLTVEGINPTEVSQRSAGSGGKGGSGTVAFSMEGDSIGEVSRRLSTGVARKVVYSHMRALILGEDLAREDISELLDYLERFREIRNDFNILIAHNAAAGELLKVLNPVQKITSMRLHEQINVMAKEWGGDPYVRMNDLITALTSPGREAVTAIVTWNGGSLKDAQTSKNRDTSAPTMLVLGGLAVFKGGKMIGELSLDDTRNYLWTQKNLLKQTSITAPCREGDQSLVDISVYHSKTKIETEMKDGIPRIHVGIYGEGRLDETQCPLDLSKHEVYADLSRRLGPIVEKEVAGTIKKVQSKYGVDIFGFGETLDRQHHKQFVAIKDKWNEYFAKADVEVTAEIRLRRAGTRTKSFLEEQK